MTSSSGLLLNFKWPYHANVMKTFEQVSSTMGSQRDWVRSFIISNRDFWNYEFFTTTGTTKFLADILSSQIIEFTTAPEYFSPSKTVSRRRRCRCRNGKCSRRGRYSFDSPQSFSVGVKGRPRSPLNSFFSRRSLELLLRRMTPGATSWLLSRRARRPLSQSSQVIEPSIGMQGAFDFEFIGDFFHQLLTLW